MQCFASEGYSVGYQMATIEGVCVCERVCSVFLNVSVWVPMCVYCITMLRLSSIRKVQSVEPLISILNNAVCPGARERSDPLTL